MLKTIEKITRQAIEPMLLPSAKIINEQRILNFKQRITQTIENQDLSIFSELVQSYQKENEVDLFKIASSLALMAQGTEPLLLSEKEVIQPKLDSKDNRTISISIHADPLKDNPSIQMRRYKISLGRKDNIKPGNILGAIANEAEISSAFIGSIQIYQDFTTVDLPDEMPKEILQILKNTRVFDKKLNMEELTDKNNKTSPRESSNHFKRDSSRKRRSSKPKLNRDKKFKRNRSKR